jgi:hypothetical protein
MEPRYKKIDVAGVVQVVSINVDQAQETFNNLLENVGSLTRYEVDVFLVT